MSADYVFCSTCGGSYHCKDQHDCPGNLDDHDTRLSELKKRVDELENGKTDDETRQDERLKQLEDRVEKFEKTDLLVQCVKLLEKITESILKLIEKLDTLKESNIEKH